MSSKTKSGSVSTVNRRFTFVGRFSAISASSVSSLSPFNSSGRFFFLLINVQIIIGNILRILEGNQCMRRPWEIEFCS
jgi:hypothetical protein